MGYTFFNNAEEFSANSWGMDILRPVLLELGIAFMGKESWAKSSVIEIKLIETSNIDYISAESCKKIIQALSGLSSLVNYRFSRYSDDYIVLDDQEREYVERFREFCEKCADTGFFVT